MSTKQNLCQHVIFSQNCCFVANFVNEALVDDSTTTDFTTNDILNELCLTQTAPEVIGRPESWEAVTQVAPFLVLTLSTSTDVRVV